MSPSPAPPSDSGKTEAAPKRRYNIPVLSGSAYLGQLYDGKTDNILSEQFFFYPGKMTTKTANIENVHFDTKLEDTQMERMNNMELDASLKMSLWAGMLSVSISDYS